MNIHTTRSRVSDDLVTAEGWTQLSDLPYLLYGTYSTYKNYGEIHDNVNRKFDGHYRPSNVRHITHKTDLNPFSAGSVADGRTYFTGNSPFPIYPSEVNALLPDVPDSLWEEHCMAAFNGFSTQIPEEVSIANFTWELREIGQLLPRLSSTISKSIAGGFLNFSFGWKPFVKDLQKLGNLFGTVDAKIQHLINTWGKTVRLGYYRGRVIDDVIPIPQLVSCGGGHPYSSIAVAGHRADFRAGGRLYHQLKGLNSMSGDIRACISALGLNNPVKVVWNAIPYSFVAGWFTRISRHLDTLAINPFKGRWEVSDLSFSLTERIVIYGYRNEPLNSTFWGEQGRVEVSRYTRLDGFPIGVTSFNLNDLNPSQLTLLAALTVGRY